MCWGAEIRTPGVTAKPPIKPMGLFERLTGNVRLSVPKKTAHLPYPATRADASLLLKRQMEVIEMKRLMQRGGVAAATVAAIALSLVQVALAAPVSPSAPTGIDVPAGNKVFLVGHAVGVQIYVCGATASGYGWSFVAPRADLYDDRGKLIATHFAGPTWRTMDGSYVKGQVVNRATVDSASIPWLLLSATVTGGTDGDRLADTTYIQRVATIGGLAPAAAACFAGTAGTIQEVAYSADYYFWKATGA